MSPKVLLFDEPTSALDPELRREIPDDEDLGEVYRTHRPLGSPPTGQPEREHHPLA